MQHVGGMDKIQTSIHTNQWFIQNVTGWAFWANAVRKEFRWTLKVEPAYSPSLPMLISIHLQRAAQSRSSASYNSVCLCPHSALPHSSYRPQEIEFRTLHLEKTQGHFPHPQNVLLMVDAGNLGSQSRMYQWINCLIRIPINCQAINENIWWFWCS